MVDVLAGKVQASGIGGPSQMKVSEHGWIDRIMFQTRYFRYK